MIRQGKAKSPNQRAYEQLRNTCFATFQFNSIQFKIFI